jgi:hypothetical protein
MTDDDFEWADPHDEMGLWEHQGKPLTVRDLLTQLSEAHLDLPVEISVYNGMRASQALKPLHVDARVALGVLAALVITVS